MSQTKIVVAMALVVLGSSAKAVQAAPITVQNPSFESPFVTGNGGLYQGGTPDFWTSTGFGGNYIERQDNGGFTGQPGITGANNQYIALDGSGTFTQNLLVPFLAHTTYTVDLAGGHRGGFAGSYVEFGVQSSANPGVDLAGATIGFINENALATSTFNFASALGANGGVFTFVTGNVAPVGDLVAFIRTSSGARLHADSFSIDALTVIPPAPEPSSMLLVCGSLLALQGVVRRRRATGKATATSAIS